MSESQRMKTVGLIPARIGSKGIPRKNIRDFCGKPLLAHTIEQALRMRSLDRLIVSTDSPEVATIAEEYGAKAPFLRPSALAAATSTDLAVVQHFVTWLEETEDYRADTVVYLRPTCPFRRVSWIEEAILKCWGGEFDAIRAVSRASHPPHWMFRLDGEYLSPLLGHETNLMRRQDLPDVYQPNGTFEIIKRTTLVGQGSLYGERVGYFLCDDLSIMDIDTELQFRLAEAQFRILSEGGDL